MTVPEINYCAVLVATASSMVVGAVWYARGVMAERWARLAGVDLEHPSRRPLWPIITTVLMSFITAINELSSTLILYTARTVTMPVKIYLSVVDGEFGVAAALSTVLTLSTGLCVFLVFRLSEDKEANFV